jgi:hypothetical protein
MDGGGCQECVGGVGVERSGNIALFPQDLTAIDLVRYVLVFLVMLALQAMPALPTHILDEEHGNR